MAIITIHLEANSPDEMRYILAGLAQVYSAPVAPGVPTSVPVAPLPPLVLDEAVFLREQAEPVLIATPAPEKGSVKRGRKAKEAVAPEQPPEPTPAPEPAPEPAPAPAATPVFDGPPPSMDEVGAAATDAMAELGMTEGKALFKDALSKVGATKLSEIKADDRAAVIAYIKAAVNSREGVA